VDLLHKWKVHFDIILDTGSSKRNVVSRKAKNGI
jgi:hypothetical protein